MSDAAELARGNQGRTQRPEGRVFYLSHCVVSMYAQVAWPNKPFFLAMSPRTIKRLQSYIGLVIGACLVRFICDEYVSSDAVNNACSDIQSRPRYSVKCRILNRWETEVTYALSNED